MSKSSSPELFEQSDSNDEEEKENRQDKSAKPPKVDKSKSTKLPLARVKAIMKLEPDANLLSQESVLLVARAAEMFLKHLAKETYVYTTKAKRKTLQRRDLDAAIENIGALAFLEGNLD